MRLIGDLRFACLDLPRVDVHLLERSKQELYRRGQVTVGTCEEHLELQLPEHRQCGRAGVVGGIVQQHHHILSPVYILLRQFTAEILEVDLHNLRV